MTALALRDGRVVTLRPAVNADRDAVMALIFEVLAEYGLKGETSGTDACVNDLEGNYAGKGGIFEVVLAADGRIVGCYGLMPHEPGVCELRKMYLLREVRGGGLGKALMERALAKARELGFRKVELDTASQLKEAIALYERFGFKTVPKAGIPARCDRAMELELEG